MVQLGQDEAAALEWDVEADAVVVGSGAAAFSAALTAASRGASVVMLEASEIVGGTTAKSGGTTWIPSNSMMREAGLPDDRDAALAYLARLSFPADYRAGDAHLGLDPADFALLETFCDTGHVAIDELVALGAIVYRDRLRPDGTPFPPYPDYQLQLPESRGVIGRSMSPGVPAGVELPRDFLMDGSLLPGGMIMVETMRQKAVQLGVDLKIGHRVVDVVTDDTGRAIGVLVHASKQTKLIGARRGVVFGSGGFLMDRLMTRDFLKGRIAGGASAETNQGDFVRIASKLGARLGLMNQAWWTQTVFEMSISVPSALELVWYPFGDSMIQVNKYGRRVVNEKQVYNERGQIHFEWNATALEYSNQLMFQLYDDAVASNPLVWPYRGLTPMPGESTGYVIRGESLEDLVICIAARLDRLAEHTGGISLAPEFTANLCETIDRFNGFAERGVDDDFQRGESPIQVLVNGPGRPGAKNPCMAPLSAEGPYYCIIMAAGAIDTKGGPKINNNAQVLDSDLVPIPGLYGAGNCVASPFGQAYPGAGGSIGAALTFGYIAGRHLTDGKAA